MRGYATQLRIRRNARHSGPSWNNPTECFVTNLLFRAGRDVSAVKGDNEKEVSKVDANDELELYSISASSCFAFLDLFYSTVFMIVSRY